MNDKLKENLKHFGFTDQETEVYLTVLSLGKASVTQIANKLDKGRTAIYFHIKNLQDKGILKETRVGKRQHYTALPPDQLMNNIESWASNLQELIPQIEVAKVIERETPMVEVTDSRQGYVNLYRELGALSEGQDFRVLEGKQAMEMELDLMSEKELRRFLRALVKKNIGTHALFTVEARKVPGKTMSKENLELFKQRRGEVRTLTEKQLTMQQLMFVYGNKVAYLFPDTSLVVTITHQGIADAMRATFDALYSFAKPAKW